MLDLHRQIEELLQGRVLLLGMGNPDYGDDGFGVRLAEALQADGVPGVLVAGNAPECWIGRIHGDQFRGLLLLDAVDFGGEPGSVIALDTDAITTRFPQLSTHKLSLGLLAQMARANGVDRVWLLGVQPESLRAGAGLSPRVQTTLEAVRELVCRILSGAHSDEAVAQGRETR
jgi:hydrogenase maturation protease